MIGERLGIFEERKKKEKKKKKKRKKQNRGRGLEILYISRSEKGPFFTKLTI